MRRRKLALGLSALLLWSGTGCGAQGETPAPSAGGEELERVDVVLDWYPNAVHAFLYEAEERDILPRRACR